MKDFSLKSYLTSNLNLSDDEIFSIQKKCQIREYQKGEFLIQNNEFCSHTFFVEDGLLRQYYFDINGKEHILQFFPENWFVTEYETVYFNEPSKYFIQTLEPSKIAFIDDNFLKKLEDLFPVFKDLNKQLLYNQIRVLQNRLTMLMSQSAEDRYLQFVETYPDILLRVPQTMVASYLSITPESLSRIRRDLALRNSKK
ncbi:MAG: Crp/Fnr family transcriptional regulator [Ignavibacteriales bacterium]|nr:Crp/Fnr family transcriptional regulator [Ignavibacteriales bacterium]